MYVSPDIDLSEFTGYMHNHVLRSAQGLYELDEGESFTNKVVDVAGTINKEQLKMGIKTINKDIFSYAESPFKIAEWRERAPEFGFFDLYNTVVTDLITNVGGGVIVEFGVDVAQCMFSILTLNEIDSIEWGTDIFKGTVKGIFATAGSLIIPGPVGKIVFGTVGKVVADIMAPLYRTQEGLALGGVFALGGAVAGAAVAIALCSNPAGWFVGVCIIAGAAVGIAASLIFDLGISLSGDELSFEFPVSVTVIGGGGHFGHYTSNIFTISALKEAVFREYNYGGESYISLSPDTSVAEPIACLTPVGQRYPKILIYDLGQVETFKNLFLENEGTTNEYYTINWEYSPI